jgi:hypothetical protein
MKLRRAAKSLSVRSRTEQEEFYFVRTYCFYPIQTQSGLAYASNNKNTQRAIMGWCRNQAAFVALTIALFVWGQPTSISFFRFLFLGLSEGDESG